MTGTAIATRGGAIDETRSASGPVTRSQATLEGLRRQKEKLEGVFDTAAELRQTEQWGNHYCGPASSHPPKAGTYRAVWVARTWLEQVPARAILSGGVDAVEAAASARADERTARFLVGLLLSSYPNAGKERKDEYFASLLFDVIDEGHSPHVLARACTNLRRNTTFLPSVGEVLAACAEARRTLIQSLDYGRQLLAMHDACAGVLEAWSRGPDEWSDAEWFALANEWKTTSTEGGRDARPWPEHLGPAPHRIGTRFPDHLRLVVGFPPLDMRVGG